MKRTPFFILVSLIAIGIILLNTVNDFKYLTCEDPENYVVTVNSVEDDEVDITVMTISSGETFSSYEYHIDGTTLYIGAKFTMNPLSDNPTGSHTFSIETDVEITEIIAKGGTEEVKVYPRD